MKDGDKGVSSYVRKTAETTNKYMHDLLKENERLRAALAIREKDNERNNDRLSRFQDMVEQNSVLQSMVTLMNDQLEDYKRKNLKLNLELAATKKELDELRRVLDEIKEENRRYSDQYESIESHNHNLVSLYVTAFRLHGTLDRGEVLTAINETIINLVGSEDFAVYELDEEKKSLVLVNSFGIDNNLFDNLPLDEGPIGRLVQQGELFIAEPGGEIEGLPGGKKLSVFVPFYLDGRLSGGIMIFSLLPQKSALEELDMELFDLLATHAATALYCTSHHSDLQ